MGSWSHEPFGNDTACDWAFDLEELRDFSLVETALRAVLDNGDEYLDSDLAIEAIAAAEVLAISKGAGTQSDAYTEDVEAWVATLDAAPPPELFDLATRALARILAPESELRELWEESANFIVWEASIVALQAALAR